MVELADIFLRHGPDYRAKFGDRMPRNHLKVMRAIEQCRTKALGGRVFKCKKCSEEHYAYHSCRNRHCPKCQNAETTAWLKTHSNLLLPVPYFFCTFTLPKELRPLVRANPRDVYQAFFSASASALKKLALDSRHLGGHIGFMGILHTWTRILNYHPHIHYIIPGGGLSPDGERWFPTQNPKYIVPAGALSIIFRAKFRDELARIGLLASVPASVWQKNKKWVINIKRTGMGETALKYLAPYVFRVALSNHRLESLEDGKVTFRFKDSKSGEWKRKTLDAEEFIRRFLQHVLPDRFFKVRYFGFLAHRSRCKLEKIRTLLGFNEEESSALKTSSDDLDEASSNTCESFTCPKCGGVMVQIGILHPKRRPP